MLHKASAIHKTAVHVVVTVPISCADVGNMLSAACALKYQYSFRLDRALLCVGMEMKRTAISCNCCYYADLKSYRYTSPQIQNELLKPVAVQV